jgi:hypothetical protein
MTEKNRKIAIGACVLIVILALAAVMFGGGVKGKSKETGPEDVVLAFIEAMKAGDFDKARSLCDVTSMKEYMDAYIQRWNTLSQKDSASFVSTKNLISETEVHLIDKLGAEFKKSDMQEEKGTCIVRYMIEMAGNQKECFATLRLEEGEWKITEITSEI